MIPSPGRDLDRQTTFGRDRFEIDYLTNKGTEYLGLHDPRSGEVRALALERVGPTLDALVFLRR